jgi:Protein of unknown function (DUF998)
MPRAAYGKTAMNAQLFSARLAMALSALALSALAGLHVLSPEFDPAKRVVSEYALGSYGWLLSVMFFAWGLGTWSLALALRSEPSTLAGRIGVVFLFAAGLGETMASVFDVSWPKMHGVSGALGVLGLPIAAMLTSLSLSRNPRWLSKRRMLLVTANLTWMSLALMVTALFFVDPKPANRRVPIGWPNRLLVVIYCVWAITVGFAVLRVRGDPTPSPAK